MSLYSQITVNTLEAVDFTPSPWIYQIRNFELNASLFDICYALYTVHMYIFSVLIHYAQCDGEVYSGRHQQPGLCFGAPRPKEALSKCFDLKCWTAYMCNELGVCQGPISHNNEQTQSVEGII